MIVPEARHNSVSRAIRQPTSPIREVTESEGFTRKNDDGQEADFRLANRRLLSQEGMVGKAGFEPAISRSRTECSSRLNRGEMVLFRERQRIRALSKAGPSPIAPPRLPPIQP